MLLVAPVTVDAATAFHPDLPPAAFHIAHWLHSFGAAKVSQVAEAGVTIDGDRGPAAAQLPGEWHHGGEIAMDRQGNMYATDPELAGIFKATPPYARALPRN